MNSDGLLRAMRSCFGLALVAGLAALMPPAAAQVEEYGRALALANEGHDEAAFETLRQLVREWPCFPRGHRRLLITAARLKKSDESRAWLEGLASEHGCAYYGLALYYRQQRRPELIAEQARQALRLKPDLLPAYSELVDAAGRESSGEVETYLRSLPTGPGPLFGLGYLYRARGDAAKALEFFDKAAEAWGAWEVEEQRYFIYYETDRLDDALGALTRMLDQAVRDHDSEREGVALGRSGLTQGDLGNYESALPALRRSIDLVHAAADRNNEQIFRANLGVVYAYLGRHREALDQFREAHRIASDLGLARSAGRNMGLIAGLHAQTANYQEAIQAYTQSLETARNTKDRPNESDQLAGLGMVHAALGDYVQALKTVREALTIAIELKNPWLEGRFQENLGSLLAESGRRAEAVAAYTKGMQIARRIGDRLGSCTRLAFASELQARAGRRTMALRGLEEALKEARQIGARIVEGRIWNDIGGIRLQLGEIAAAQSAYRQALDIGREANMPEVIWRAHAGLSRVSEAYGRVSEAARQNAEAIEAIERIRSRVGMPGDKAGFLENKIDAYRRQVRLLISLGGGRPSSPYTEQAFQYSERARARGFLDSVAESPVALRHENDGDLTARQQEIEVRLSQLQARLIAADSRTPRDARRVQRLTNELTDADSEYVAIRREVRGRIPDYAAFRYPEPLELRAAQALVPEDSVVLAYSLGGASSFVFAISRKQFAVARLPSAAAIAMRVGELRKAIAGDPARSAISNYIVQATALYRELILPVGALLAGKREMIIVPDGAVHYLPFPALIESGTDDPGVSDATRLPYLIRSHSIRYTPSLSVLAALKARPAPDAPAKSLLGVAEPRYSTRLPLRPLIHSRKEMERVSQSYPAGVRSILTDNEATEENVKENAGNFRILHFAVHGMLNEHRPAFSGLALTPSATDDGENGLLQTYEILGLRLRAGLVILSACETGLGKLSEGEGLASLTRAFLHAGARSVVASLWKVDDRSTSELMIKLHQDLRASGADASQALRHAQLDLIGRGEYAHPYFWAAFAVTGDSR